jgi:hypothetical protein
MAKLFYNFVDELLEQDIELSFITKDNYAKKLDTYIGKNINYFYMVSGELNPFIYNRKGNRIIKILENEKHHAIKDFTVVCGPNIWSLKKDVLISGELLKKGNRFIDALSHFKNKKLFYSQDEKQPIHFFTINKDTFIFENHFNFVIERDNMDIAHIQNTNPKVSSILQNQLKSNSVLKEVENYKTIPVDASILEEKRTAHISALIEMSNYIEKKNECQ